MHWYDWHTVTERLQGRAYALTRGRPYKVTLDPKTATGCCDFTNKKILINPNLFSDVFQAQGLSGDILDKANFLVSRAVTGHEALHVLYSDPKTVSAVNSPVEKIVLNLLEDARIERIGASQSSVSKFLFLFVNGIARAMLPAFADWQMQDRQSWIILLLRWRLGAEIPALNSDAVQTWSQVLLLANKALYAPTCNDVLLIAREIVILIGGDNSSDDSPEEESDVMKRTESNLSGSRDSAALPNPIENDGSQNQDLSSENSEHVPSSNGAVDLKPSDEAPESSTRVEGENSVTDAATEDNADTNSIERLVEQTSQAVCEDLDSLVPLDSADSPLIARAKSYRGRDYSDVTASPYAHYLSDAAPIAAEIVRDLKTEGPKAVSGPSPSPGRFKSRYYIRDFAKPFSAHSYRGMRTPPMALSIVIDRSGSMEEVIDELRLMSMSIVMACVHLSLPLSVWALEGQVHIKKFDEHGPQVLAKIAGIQADTLTRVLPTLRDAVKEISARPEELKQIVLIHDGMPCDRINFIRWRKELRGIGLFCMFILTDEQYEAYRQNPGQLREMMDELVGPKNYAIAPVTGIARHWCSYIRNIRNRHSSPAH